MQIATKDDFDALLSEVRAMRQRLDELAPPPEWISVAEYMERKEVSKSTVYRRIKEWKETGEGLQARGTGKTREVRI